MLKVSFIRGTNSKWLQRRWKTRASRSGWRCPASRRPSTWRPPSIPQRWAWAVCAAGRARRRCCPPPSKSRWTLRGTSRCVSLSQPHFLNRWRPHTLSCFHLKEFLVALRLQGATMRHYMTQTNHSWHEQVRGFQLSQIALLSWIVFPRILLYIVSVPCVKNIILTLGAGPYYKRSKYRNIVMHT